MMSKFYAQVSGPPCLIEVLHLLNLILPTDQHDLTPTLFKNTVHNAVLVQEPTQRQKVFLKSGDGSVVSILRQLTRAVLQLGLSMQLA